MIKEADNKDMMDWLETAVEVLPEISTEIKQIIEKDSTDSHTELKDKPLPERIALITQINPIENFDISGNSIFLQSMDQRDFNKNRRQSVTSSHHDNNEILKEIDLEGQAEIERKIL